MITRYKALIFTASLFANTSIYATTIAQALGYPPSAKLLLIHADDLGSVNAANHAAADLFAQGGITSASVMMDGPAAAEAVAYARANPLADMGVHLTLTSEWSTLRWGPVSPLGDVPSLVNHFDSFFPGFFPLFVWGRKDDVAKELDAQVEAALAAGLEPSHVDTHMGSAFYRPAFFRSYLETARRHKIPPMVPRWSDELKQSFFGSFGGEMMELLAGTGLFSASGLLQGVEDDGYLLVDHLYMHPVPVSPNNSFAARKAFYLEMIRRLKPGASEIIIHPAYNEGDFAYILHADSKQILRDHEARIFQDPEVLQALRDAGVQLITWRDIGRAYDWSKVKAR